MSTNLHRRDPALAALQEECETQLLNLPFGVYYFGTRLSSGRCIVFVGEDGQVNGELSACGRAGNEATDWDWGGKSPGATHLSLALLSERITDPATAIAHHHEFACDIIAQLPLSKWVLSGIEIAKWLNRHEQASPDRTELHQA
jgi:hypothetical protein